MYRPNVVYRGAGVINAHIGGLSRIIVPQVVANHLHKWLCWGFQHYK